MTSLQRANLRATLSIFVWLVLAATSISLGLSNVNCIDLPDGRDDIAPDQWQHFVDLCEIECQVNKEYQLETVGSPIAKKLYRKYNDAMLKRMAQGVKIKVYCCPPEITREYQVKHVAKQYGSRRFWFKKLTFGKSKDKECYQSKADANQLEYPESKIQHATKFELQKPVPHPDEIDESFMSDSVKRFRQLCREEYALSTEITSLQGKLSGFGDWLSATHKAKVEERIAAGIPLGLNMCPDDIVNIHGPVVRPPLRDVNDYHLDQLVEDSTSPPLIDINDYHLDQLVKDSTSPPLIDINNYHLDHLVEDSTGLPLRNINDYHLDHLVEDSTASNILSYFPRPTPHPDEIDESSLSDSVKKFRQLCRDEYALASRLTNLKDKLTPEGKSFALSIANALKVKSEARIDAGIPLKLHMCPDDIVNAHGPVKRQPMQKEP